MSNLQRIELIALVHHPMLGVLFTKKQISEGSFTFLSCELKPNEDWRNILYLHIKQSTWIEKNDI